METIQTINPPSGMVVRFISDLHYGHERCEAPAPADLVKQLTEGIGMLVVVGDLAETRACPWQAAGVRLRNEMREECSRRGVQLVEISGNHDPDTNALLIRFWDGRVIAMHGHALYKEVAPWSWEYINNKAKCHELIRSMPECDERLDIRLELSRRMCQLTTPIMRREGIKNKYLRGFLHCFWPPQRPWRIVSCWLRSARLAERFARHYTPDARFLILGHFHRSGSWRFGNRQIFNCGAWFRHATPYCVDMQDGHLLAYRKLKQ